MAYSKSPGRRRQIFRFDVLGSPFGMWVWRHRFWPPTEEMFTHKIKGGGKRIEKWGMVIRFGNMGHLQFQRFEDSWGANGRKRKREWTLHWWGVNGRRRKRGIGVHSFW